MLHFFLSLFRGQLVEGQIVEMSRTLSIIPPLVFRKIIRNERLPYGQPSCFFSTEGAGVPP